MDPDPRRDADRTAERVPDPARDDRDEALWSRVQAALDAGRDPLANPELAAALRARPTLAARVERLCERLELLSLLPPAPGPVATARADAVPTRSHASALEGLDRRDRPDRRAALAPGRAGSRWSAGLGAAAAVLLAWATLHGLDPTPITPPHAAPAPAPVLGGSQVREAHLRLEHLRPEPPAPTVVHHAPRRVLAWTLPGDPR